MYDVLVPLQRIMDQGSLGAAWIVPFTLVVLTVVGVWTALANLRPAGVAADPSTWSDGLWARVAWRGRHHRGPMWPG